MTFSHVTHIPIDNYVYTSMFLLVLFTFAKLTENVLVFSVLQQNLNLCIHAK